MSEKEKKVVAVADERLVAAARVVYLKLRGRDHRRIKREMESMGYRFSRRHLYMHQHSSSTLVGWPERFGWDEELRAAGVVVRKRRNAGRNRFEDWLHKTQRGGGMKWSWDFQRVLYEKLAEVTAGRCKRLMIFMPPRHGKSELVTMRYVAWRLLEDPALNVILGSYSQQLASKFSRGAKRIVEEGEFQNSRSQIPEFQKEEGSENISVHLCASVDEKKALRLGGSAVKRALTNVRATDTRGHVRTGREPHHCGKWRKLCWRVSI